MSDEVDFVRHDVSAVKSAEGDYGWFKNLLPAEPDIYSTYHFLHLSDINGITIAYPKQTVALLNEVIENEFINPEIGSLSSREKVALRDVYNAVEGIALLNTEYHNTDQILRLVDEFRTPCGGYTFTVPRSGRQPDEDDASLIGTYYAVSILSRLEALETQSSTRERLIDLWERQLSGPDGNLSRSSRLVRSLDKCGVDPTSFDGYGRWREQIVAELNRTRTTDDDSDGLFVDRVNGIIEHTDIETDDIDIEFQRLISNGQLDDGGFNIAGRGYSEPHGTAVYTTTANQWDVSIDTGPLESLIEAKQLPTGGFMASFRQEHLLHCTYYAHEALGTVREAPLVSGIPNDILATISNGSLTKDFEFVYKLLSVVSEQLDIIDPANVAASIERYFQDNIGDLSELYYVVLIAEMMDHELSDVQLASVAEKLDDEFNEDGGYGDVSNSADTFFATQIALMLDIEVDAADDTVAWLERSRTDDGGYRFRNDGTVSGPPNLHATYLSVGTLEALDSDAIDKNAVLEFVLSCRCPDGGYSVEPTSDGSVERSLRATYYAMRTLERLTTEDDLGLSVQRRMS